MNIPESISLECFKLFLEQYQGETKTIAECEEIFKKYEPTSDQINESNTNLSFMGFVNYINDDGQFIDNQEHERVYQDMSQPFSHYFINSSHNTFVLFATLKTL